MNVTSLAQEILATTMFWTHEDCPFRASLSAADEKLLVIAGPNASGKSLMCQFLATWAHGHTPSILPVSISIRERTGSGTSDISGMRRTFMFGDETQQSTGTNSVSVAINGFRNVVDRRAMLILDEPDMGLSEDYAHAFGQLIAQEHADVVAKNPSYHGLVLVTHSRSLVSGLLAAGANPSFLAAGMDADLPSWLEMTATKTMQELLALPEVARERRHRTRELLNG